MAETIGLMQALYTAGSGIQANQTAIGVAADNIANKDNESYTIKTAVFGSLSANGRINGVTIEKIERFNDIFLDTAIRNSGSNLAKNDTIRNYLAQMVALTGEVNSDSNANKLMSETFKIISQLANNTADVSIKNQTVNSFKTLTYAIADLAQGIYQYQYDVDQEIANSVEVVNNILDNLKNLNTEIPLARSINGQANDLEAKRDFLLKDLANYIDCKAVVNGNGSTSASLNDGGDILLGRYNSRLQYQPQTSVDNFINQSLIAPITVNTYNSINTVVLSTNIVTGGVDPTSITSTLKSGKIQGLIEIRDHYAPKYLQLLNNLATNLTEQFNKIHNTGSGYPPVSSFLSAKSVTAGDTDNWTGNVKFAVVDQLGKPIYRNDGSVIKPLDLNLTTLKSGTISGQVTVQTMLDEFNRYFASDATAPHTSLGKLTTGNSYSTQSLIRDIRIAATSDLSTQPLGVFNFDIELDSDSQFNCNFQVLDVIVKDVNGNVVNNALTNAVPGNFALTAGQRVRTQQPLSINFGATASSGGPFNIELITRVAGENGIVETGGLNFTINDNPLNPAINNQRFLPTSVTGQAVTINADLNQIYASAKIIDTSGNELLNNYSLGNISLATANSNMRLIIQDDTSQELGLNTSITPATNRGFGHYFGLNNLLIESAQNRQSALNFRLRDDIAAVSSNLATGQLSAVNSQYQVVNTIAQAATGSIKFDLTQVLPLNNDSLTINGTIFHFSNATMPVPINPITIGVDWPTTINNIVSTLTAVNATTANAVNCATYQFDGVNSVNINYNQTGIIGNNFTIDSNFAATTISINDRKPALTDSSSLYGGTAAIERTEIAAFGYQLSAGANQVTNKMLDLQNKAFYFTGSNLNITVNTSFTGYLSAIISSMTSDLTMATTITTSEKDSYNGYISKFKQDGGVDTDQQLMNIVKYQQAHQANAKAFKIIQELFDVLINAL